MKKNDYILIALLVITAVVSAILWNFPYTTGPGDGSAFLYKAPKKKDPPKPPNPPKPPKDLPGYAKKEYKNPKKSDKFKPPVATNLSSYAEKLNNDKSVKNEDYAKKLFQYGYLFKDEKGFIRTRQDDKNYPVRGAAGTNTSMGVNQKPEKNPPKEDKLKKIEGTGTFYNPSNGKLYAKGKDGLYGVPYKEITGPDGKPRFVDIETGNPLPKNVTKDLVEAGGGSGKMALDQGFVKTAMDIGKATNLKPDKTWISVPGMDDTYVVKGSQTIQVVGENGKTYGVKYHNAEKDKNKPPRYVQTNGEPVPDAINKILLQGRAGVFNTSVGSNTTPEKISSKDLQQIPNTGMFLGANDKLYVRGSKDGEYYGAPYHKDGNGNFVSDITGKKLPKQVVTAITSTSPFTSGADAAARKEAAGVHTNMSIGNQVYLSMDDINKLHKVPGTNKTFMHENGTLYVQGGAGPLQLFPVEYSKKTVNGKEGFYDNADNPLPKNVQTDIEKNPPNKAGGG